MPQIKWTQEAIKDLKSLDKIIAKRVVEKISWFGDNFESLTPEMLSNELSGLYKIRVGDYRVVYSLNNDNLTIKWVGHRKEVYKK